MVNFAKSCAFFGLVLFFFFPFGKTFPPPFIGQMTDLIYTERELVKSLKEYIEAEEMKLEAVKR